MTGSFDVINRLGLSFESLVLEGSGVSGLALLLTGSRFGYLGFGLNGLGLNV